MHVASVCRVTRNDSSTVRYYQRLIDLKIKVIILCIMYLELAPITCKIQT